MSTCDVCQEMAISGARYAFVEAFSLVGQSENARFLCCVC